MAWGFSKSFSGYSFESISINRFINIFLANDDAQPTSFELSYAG